MTRFSLFLSLFICGSLQANETGQKWSLGETETDRFELTDRVWAQTPEEPHVYLWKNDSLTTISITIDDNMPGDHDWWIEMGDKFKMRFIWFVTTALLDDPKSRRGT